jgi:hypothetical protein
MDETSKCIESTYLYTKMNNTLKAQYKTEYLLSILHKYIRNIIYSNEKKRIYIKNIMDDMKDDVSKNYNEDTLMNEIILLLNVNNSLSPILINRIVDVCILDDNLVNEYKLLKLKRIGTETLQKLQLDIHKKSISILHKLVNEKGKILSLSEIKEITHSIANILNSKNYTKNILNPI